MATIPMVDFALTARDRETGEVITKTADQFTEAQRFAIRHMFDNAGVVPVQLSVPANTLTHPDGRVEVLPTNPPLSPGDNVLGRVHQDGEPGQEAVVPLPDGRRIPVQITDRSGTVVKRGSIAAPTMDAATKRTVAVQSGFTGDTCGHCYGTSMKRNGSCLCCADCGATTGCS